MSTNRFKLSIFTGALCLVLAIGSCAPVTDLDKELSANSILISTAHFRNRASLTLSAAQTRLKSSTAIVAIYDDDYEYRIIYLVSGENISNPRAVPVSVAGYNYIYQEMRDNQYSFIDLGELESGDLKSNLSQGGAQSIAVAPIYNSRNYLLGYVGFAWNSENPPPAADTTELVVTSVAQEITEYVEDLSL